MYLNHGRSVTSFGQWVYPVPAYATVTQQSTKLKPMLTLGSYNNLGVLGNTHISDPAQVDIR
jgi:hypothetical protein